MPENKTEPYTVEQLQQEYAVSLHVAVEVLEHFRGDRSKIDKFMKRCPHRDEDERQWQRTTFSRNFLAQKS